MLLEADEAVAVRRGRPRDLSAGTRVLDAAIVEFAERGYDGFTLCRVAERAGVARSTLYRRWPTKADLALDVALDIMNRYRPPNLGSATTDLQAALDKTVHAINFGHDGRCVATLAAESIRNPEFAKQWSARLDEPRREQLRTVLVRGIERGELRPDIDVETIIDVLISVVPYFLMFSDRPLDADFGKRVVAVVMDGTSPSGGHQ